MWARGLLLCATGIALLASLGSPATAQEHHKTIHDGIERVYGLSDDEFFENYYWKERPVILMDATKDWKASSEWTLEKLRRRFGDQEVEVQLGREASNRFEEDKMKLRRKIRFDEFVDKVAASKDAPTNDFYLTALNRATDNPAFRSLLDDCGPMSKILNWPPPPGSHNFWLGPRGSLTPLHFDPPSLVNAHISGRKRWYLIDARDAEKLCPYEAWFARFNPANVGDDYKSCPSARDVTVYETVVGPGETLFVPSGWFHYVEGLEIATSISFTSFTRPPRRPVINGHPYLGKNKAGAGAANDQYKTVDDNSQQVEVFGVGPSEVKVHWVGERGESPLISTVQPGERSLISSFHGHVFEARTVNGTGWMVRRRLKVDRAQAGSNGNVRWLLSGEWKDQNQNEDAKGGPVPPFGSWQSAERVSQPQGQNNNKDVSYEALDQQTRARIEQARRDVVPGSSSSSSASVGSGNGEQGVFGRVLSFVASQLEGKVDL